MITKEHVKQEIDKLPNDVLDQVYLFICSIQPKKPARKHIPSFHLKGQFDHIHIRATAYE